jgi:hypothetical protein
MAGLNANVTLGPGVTPIPGQINVPAGPDELSFSDAFAEAQSTRSTGDAGSAKATQVSKSAQIWKALSRDDATHPGLGVSSVADKSDSSATTGSVAGVMHPAVADQNVSSDSSKLSTKAASRIARLKNDSGSAAKRPHAAQGADGSASTSAAAAVSTPPTTALSDSAASSGTSDGTPLEAVGAVAAASQVVSASGAAGRATPLRPPPLRQPSRWRGRARLWPRQRQPRLPQPPPRQLARTSPHRPRWPEAPASR